jgi:hypothetical protein
MEPSCTNLSLPRFASNRDGFELALCQARFQRTRFDPLIPTTQATAVKEILTIVTN